LDGAIYRDDRRMPPRRLAVLVAEIQQLESIFRPISLRSGNQPMLIRRLAEDYVELEKSASATSLGHPSKALVAARDET
jgi:hypothetical protein